MRRFLIVVAVIIAGIGGLVALGYLVPRDYVGICVDTKTHLRVPDQKCEPTSNSDDWVYYDSNGNIPAVDQFAEDNIAEGPDKDDNVKRGGVPEQGQQASSNSDDDRNAGNTGGGGFEPAGGGGSDVGVNSGDEGGDENAGSGGGGEDGE